jgi:glutaredoxin 3
MNAAKSTVIIYSSPFCGYCSAAKRLLDKKSISYTEIDVMFAPDLRAEMVARSGRQTVPQVFIGDKHIGGFDDLAALDKRGELDKLLVDVSVPLSP